MGESAETQACGTSACGDGGKGWPNFNIQKKFLVDYNFIIQNSCEGIPAESKTCNLELCPPGNVSNVQCNLYFTAETFHFSVN